MKLNIMDKQKINRSYKEEFVDEQYKTVEEFLERGKVTYRTQKSKIFSVKTNTNILT